MILWLILAVMTAAAVFAVLWPLSSNAGSVRSGGSDMAVYRDQLDEIERDRTGGLIGDTEAEAARMEISRRLLAAADAAQATPLVSNATSAALRRRAAAVASLVVAAHRSRRPLFLAWIARARICACAGPERHRIGSAIG